MFAARFPERGLSRDRLDSLIEEQDADRIAQALHDHVRESKPAWKFFVLERRLPSPRARHGAHHPMPRDIRLVLY